MATSSIQGEAWDTLSVSEWAGMTNAAWETLPVDVSTSLGGFGQKQAYYDSETHFYLLGTGSNPGRYYDPATTRFASEDPIRQSGGDINVETYVWFASRLVPPGAGGDLDSRLRGNDGRLRGNDGRLGVNDGRGVRRGKLEPGPHGVVRRGIDASKT